jgi:LysM domain
VQPSDPYSNGFVIQFADGNMDITRTPLTLAEDSTDFFYQVMSGDTILSIAHKVWEGEEPQVYRYWYVLADLNGLVNPLELEVGQQLRVPSFSRVRNALRR